MKAYDVRCPYCGKLNRSVYLEETDGWMECVFCNATSRTADSDTTPGIPVRIIPPLHMAVTTCKGA